MRVEPRQPRTLPWSEYPRRARVYAETRFASAGVLSVVSGLAAQTSLGAAFAGIQIAFSDAIRVGDVVVLEDEWGRIEEITLTYVVVHLWDERRLVLPCTYFTTTPFQNWTRNATQLLGTAELDVDFTVPFDAMRAELRVPERSRSGNPKRHSSFRAAKGGFGTFQWQSARRATQPRFRRARRNR